MLSMTSKPKVEPPALGPAPFSPGVVGVSSSSSEASQPWEVEGIGPVQKGGII
jgi:hypothetical protein